MRRLLLISSSAVLVGKLAGFARGVVLAGFLGASVELDAYNGLLVLAGALVFIVADQFEMLVSAEAPRHAADGTEAFRRYARETLGVGALAGTVLGVVTVLLYPLVGPLLVPGAGRVPQLALGLAVLPVIVLQIPIRAAAALLRGGGRAAWALSLEAVQGIAFLLSTLAALALWAGADGWSGVRAAALAHTFTTSLIFVLQLTGVARLIGAWPLAWTGPRAVTAFARRMSALSGLSALGYCFTLIDRHFAARAWDGGLSLVNYAGNISLTVRSVLSYEHLFVVEFARATDRGRAYRDAVATCLWLTVPLSCVLPVFAPEIVTLVFQRGQFTAAMSAQAARVLAIYGGATTLFLLWQLLFRILQTEQLLPRLFLPYALALAVSLAATPVTTAAWGLPGAIAGTILGSTLLLAWGLGLAWQRGHVLIPRRTLAAVAGAAVYAWAVSRLLRQLLPRGVIGTAAVIAAAIVLASAPTVIWWTRSRRDGGRG